MQRILLNIDIILSRCKRFGVPFENLGINSLDKADRKMIDYSFFMALGNSKFIPQGDKPSQSFSQDQINFTAALILKLNQTMKLKPMKLKKLLDLGFMLTTRKKLQNSTPIKHQLKVITTPKMHLSCLGSPVTPVNNLSCKNRVRTPTTPLVISVKKLIPKKKIIITPLNIKPHKSNELPQTILQNTETPTQPPTPVLIHLKSMN